MPEQASAKTGVRGKHALSKELFRE